MRPAPHPRRSARIMPPGTRRVQPISPRSLISPMMEDGPTAWQRLRINVGAIARAAARGRWAAVWFNVRGILRVLPLL